MSEARQTEMLEDIHEEKTGAAIAICYDHHEIHQSHLFRVNFTTVSLAADAALALLITPPTTAHARPYVHLRAWGAGNTNGAVEVMFVEKPAATTVIGATIAAVNHNRNSSVTSSVAVIPQLWTTNTTSIVLSHYVEGSDNNQGRIGPGSLPGMEMVLQPGVTYGIKMINRSAGAGRASLNLSWYQESENLS